MKKIPLGLYILVFAGLVLLIVSLFMGVRLIRNHSYVSAYEKGEYRTEQEEKLLKMNFPESFVPYYNLGNAAYKQGDYNSAIGYYNQALTMYPTGDKDCQIRINLALSLCNTIDFYNLDSQEKIDTALFVLYKARDVLLEDGCASDDGQGHNADAQQLKEDIDRMIEKLKNPDQSNTPQQSQSDQQPDNSDGSSGGNGPSDKEKRVQNELEENKKNALEDRKDQQGSLEKWSDYVGGQGEGEDDSGEDGGGSEQNTSPW